MKRIALTLGYNGAKFSGSQVQARTDNTVMGVLQRSLNRLGVQSVAVASGRTDAGVHAFRQVVHLDLPPHWQQLRSFHTALEHQLPPSIRVRHIQEVPEAFHARFSAKWRAYRYLLSETPPSPFNADFVTPAPRLDLPRIQEAMTLFVGEHDFELFKKSGSDVTHYVRTMRRAFAYRHGGYVILCFEANGFLRSQIRLMTAALLRVSDGSLSLAQLSEQLACRQRHCTDLALPNGLYLSNVIY